MIYKKLTYFNYTISKKIFKYNIYLDKIKIGFFQLEIQQNKKLILEDLYIFTKYRGNKYSSSILLKINDLLNIFKKDFKELKTFNLFIHSYDFGLNNELLKKKYIKYLKLNVKNNNILQKRI